MRPDLPHVAVPAVLRGNGWLLAGLLLGTAVAFWPSTATPAVVAPGARVSLETARFLVTLAAAGLMTSFGGGMGGPLRRGFVAALVVLGLTDLWFGVIPHMTEVAAGAAGSALLPWIAARYLAGALFVMAGMEWPRWSTTRLVWTALAAHVAVQLAVAATGPTTLVTLEDPDFAGVPLAQVLLELGPMVLFGAGAVLASRLYERDQQPLERWLVAALLVGVFTQVHEAAFPAGLGPVVSSADLLRALSTVLLLVGAIQQVTQLRADRARALELSQADLRELREVSSRLQDYVAQEASFRSVVTHELATPVATISAYAHVLGAAQLPTAAREAADTIGTEARRLRSLIHRMDELADVDTDALAVDLRPVAVRPLLEEAAAFGRALPGNHAVSTSVDDAVLTADPTRLSQVMRNLVGNAARYTPSGTPIHLSGHREGDVYAVVVVDEGPGFGTADVEPLFAKYRRGASGAHLDGTGLGLWIVREIVQAHGGRVHVIDPADAGGRVQVELPLEGPGGQP
ncbi:ATP-binding protein [Euzebya sp.]|uniref:sensor histidine kinase n=1 Tax=Euzebya sp. TaxID=1971409 RepID=UPI0035194245